MNLFDHLTRTYDVPESLLAHGIGLKPNSRYKRGFALTKNKNNVLVYDKTGALLADIINNQATDVYDIIPCPSQGLLFLFTYSSYTMYLTIVDVLTSTIVATMTEGLQSAGVTYLGSYDVLENGDSVILSSVTGTLYLRDKLGNLKKSLVVAGSQNSSSIVRACSAKRVLYIADGVTNKAKILNSNDLSVRIDVGVVPYSAYFKGMMADGSLVYATSSLLSQLSKTKIDYATNKVVSTKTSPQLTSGNVTYNYLGTFKDQILLSRYDATTLAYELAILDDNMQLIRTGASSPHILLSADDAFCYRSEKISPFKYHVVKRSDNTEVFSYTPVSTMNQGLIRNTKGKYENFGKYW